MVGSASLRLLVQPMIACSKLFVPNEPNGLGRFSAKAPQKMVSAIQEFRSLGLSIRPGTPKLPRAKADGQFRFVGVIVTQTSPNLSSTEPSGSAEEWLQTSAADCLCARCGARRATRGVHRPVASRARSHGRHFFDRQKEIHAIRVGRGACEITSTGGHDPSIDHACLLRAPGPLRSIQTT